ncbi:hypothetical protein JCM11251_002375 [Rhodosporidiobolus azoricus]
MPPKKKSASAPLKKLPPPNLAHPCAAFLPTALSSSTFSERPHPASYHTFLSSPFYPSVTRTSSSADEPPAKRKKKDAEPALPPLLNEGKAAIEASVVQRKLLEWYDERKEKRGMPWRKEVRLEEMSREEKSQRAYEVWVSEIMLQQTQVATVIPYWTGWMEAFPTVQDLAKADPEEVNAVWKGLGYYSRAKRLLEGAKTVVDKHQGIVPSTVEGLLEVDGIGPYTAGAVSSIAYARRSPLVDGNVQRVFSRLTAFHAPPAAKATTNFIWALADVLVPSQPRIRKKAKEEEEDEGSDPTRSPHFKRGREKEQDDLANVGGPNKPGAWNQALMELGATVCTPVNPKCEECPVSEECLGYAEARYLAHPLSAASSSSPSPTDIEDLCTLCAPLPPLPPSEAHSVEAYPMAKEKTKKREEETAVCVLEWVEEGKDGKGEEGRKVLLFKRPEKGLLAGLFEFPAVDLPPSTSSTLKTRTKAINALLPTLLDAPGLRSGLSSSATSSSGEGGVRVLERTILPPVEHIYSHMKRTYFAERIVLSSSSLPTLHKASSSSALTPKKGSKTKDASAEEVVHSLPGRGKWVDASAVEGENTGGAVGKVWEERQRSVKGLGSVKEKKTTGKGAGRVKKEKKNDEKGQGSLLGFFGKKEVKVAVKEMGKGKKRAEHSDEDLIIVEEKEEKVKATAVVKEEKENEAKVEIKVEEKKVYKKRRIAPSSDEEDEG